VPALGIFTHVSQRVLGPRRDGKAAKALAKKTAGLTIVKMLVTGLVFALMMDSLIKLKLFGGAQ